MKGEAGEAKQLFGRALEQAKAVGIREGVVEARAALRRLERLERGRAGSAGPGVSAS